MTITDIGGVGNPDFRGEMVSGSTTITPPATTVTFGDAPLPIAVHGHNSDGGSVSFFGKHAQMIACCLFLIGVSIITTVFFVSRPWWDNAQEVSNRQSSKRIKNDDHQKALHPASIVDSDRGESIQQVEEKIFRLIYCNSASKYHRCEGESTNNAMLQLNLT